MERHAVGLQAMDAGQCLVERALAAAGLAVAVVYLARAVDTDADADAAFEEQAAPFGVHQRAVGLEGMLHVDRRRPQALDGREGFAIERYRRGHGLARVPQHDHLGAGEARGEDLAEQPRHRRLGHDVLAVAIGQVAIGAVDVAERSRLHHHHADLGARHRFARWLGHRLGGHGLTSYASRCPSRHYASRYPSHHYASHCPSRRYATPQPPLCQPQPPQPRCQPLPHQASWVSGSTATNGSRSLAYLLESVGYRQANGLQLPGDFTRLLGLRAAVR